MSNVFPLLTDWTKCPYLSDMRKQHTIDWSLVDRLAEGLGVDYWARRKWIQREQVPHKWRLALIAASRGAIKPDDFVRQDNRLARG